MNFQLYDILRTTKIGIHEETQVDEGKNILRNRFYDINNMIDKTWLNLSLNTFKIKCKELFQKD